MKRIIFCLLLFFLALKTFSQDKDYFSTEFDANYYYYFVGDNSSNNFNYGFSILISKYINKVKVSSGINYSTKSYNTQGDPFWLIEKREHNLDYLNFPIITNIEIFSHRKFSSSVLTGFTFNQIIDYKIKSFYLNGETLIEDNLLNDKKLGLTFLLGTTFSKSIGNKWLLNLSPFINYKLIPDHNDQRPDYKNIPDDRVFLGFKLGIEYLFKTSDNK
ncbi:MAG: hypothetical protein GX048_03650 [Bacteroidales bacterium]|jgi:hypothetical protein|nr:hypothetical protein [Bacteroidales bacterium]